jgi:membrane fusion protein, heavy metal efflux system
MSIMHPRVSPILLALPALLWLGCGGDPAPQKIATPDPDEVRLTADVVAAMKLGIVPAERRELRATITVPASIVADPNRSASVSCLLPGRISAVAAREGARVRKGQELARVESAEYGALVADVLQTQADLIAARAEEARVRVLSGDNVTSTRQLEQASAALAGADARAAAARKKLHAIGVTPDEVTRLLAKPDAFEATLVLRAPIDGVVSHRAATIGRQTGDGAPLFEILNASTVTVQGHVFEDDFSRVRPGQRVEFTTHAFGDRGFTGTVDVVGSVIEEQTHTLPVLASIANADGSLRPNLHGRLLIHTKIPARVLAVPSAAIVIDGKDRRVFVATGETTFRCRTVATGRMFDGFIEITAGLTERDRVVATGAFQLKSQMKLSQPE